MDYQKKSWIGIYDDCRSIISTPANSSVAKVLLQHQNKLNRPSLLLPLGNYVREMQGYNTQDCRASESGDSAMQVMLGKVRGDARAAAFYDFWEQRELNYENEIKHLQYAMQEWKEKTLSFETKANQLQTQLSATKGEIQKRRAAECIEPRTRRGVIVDPQTSCLFPLNQLEESYKGLFLQLLFLSGSGSIDDSRMCYI